MLRPDGHPWIAAILDVAMARLQKQRAYLVPQAAGRTLEIGLGTGANLPYYRPDVTLCAVEPDPHMRRRAEARAASLGRAVELHAVGAEALPFREAYFDTVVATFVLCTVPDPDAVVREISRVLAPGGRLLFAEHTVSRHAVARRVQRGLNPLWRRCAGGCELSRDTLARLRAGGFTEVVVEPNPRDGWTLAPIYRGVAVR